MQKVLQTLAGLALALAIVLTFSSAPESRIETVDVALSASQVNEDRAESAPQQQVVNGWIARDLLEIQARQLDDMVAAQRMQTVILVLVGFTLVFAVTSLSSRHETSIARGAVAIPNAGSDLV